MMRSRTGITAHEVAVFAMLGTVMFAGKKIMEFLPNVHPLTMLTMVYTVVYRKKGIIPVIVYLLLDTVVTGGITWIVPYYYSFPLCWFVTPLLPEYLPKWQMQILYSAVCALFGLAFGTLYAPWQAFMFHLNWEKTVAWILAGLPWDAVHAVGNLAASLLILPLAALLRKMERLTVR